MKIVVVGAGGVGGYFGGRLKEAGLDVTLVARGEHGRAINRNGLKINSPLGDALVPIGAVENPAEIGVADVVVVATKFWQLADAAEQIAPLLGPSTVVFGVQNGVDAADKLGERIPADQLLAGSCRLISFIDGPGVIRHLGGNPSITFGERDGGISARGEAIRQEFSGARGMQVNLTANIGLELWKKIHFFAPMAGVTSVTRAPVGVVRSIPEVRAMLEGAMDEVALVAASLGFQLPPESKAQALGFVDALPPDGTSSMQRDFAAGRKTELEALNGAIARHGGARGVPVPINSFIYAALLPGA